MGGGAAVRAAAKVAGIGAVNTGIRGGFSSITPPAEHSVRNASRPVSAILSSTQNGKAGAVDMEGVQLPAWELDDWEFAGIEEESFVEQMPRVVFGPAPTLEEAKEATSDLKDALEKVYLSSSEYTGSNGGHLSTPALTNSEHVETKSCITHDPRMTISPKYAVQAFSLLNESPETQTIVASIASDPNVWDAVFKNEALQEYFQSQKTKTVADDKLQNSESPKRFAESSDDASESGSTDSSPVDDIFENIKHSVIEMANNVYNFVQNMFGFSGEKSTEAAEKNTQPSFFNNTVGASFMALAVMVIMMVVMKRA